MTLRYSDHLSSFQIVLSFELFNAYRIFFKFPSTGSIFNLILEKENREEKRITLPSGYSKCSAYAINAWNFLMLYPGHSCVGSITSRSITSQAFLSDLDFSFTNNFVNLFCFELNRHNLVTASSLRALQIDSQEEV